MKTKLLILITALFTGAVGYFIGNNHIAGSFFWKKSYSSETLVCKQFEINPIEVSNDTENLVTAILSKSNIKAAINTYRLDDLYNDDLNDLLETISKNASISRDLDTNFTKLTVLANSEQKAQQISYALTQTFKSRWESSLTQQHIDTLAVYKSKITEQKSRIEPLRKKLYEISSVVGFSGFRDKSLDVKSSLTRIEAEKLFPEARNVYEKEMRILGFLEKALYNAEYNVYPIHKFHYQEASWSDETAEFMKARKQTK